MTYGTPGQLLTAAIANHYSCHHQPYNCLWAADQLLKGKHVCLWCGTRKQGGGGGALDPEVPEEFSAEEHRHGGRLVALTGLQKQENKFF